MPADRLLSTLLRALQTYTPQQDTPRILGTAVSLLDSLNNPLNVILLVNQLLDTPALWSRPDGLPFCLSFMGVFHSAAGRVVERELRAAEDGDDRFQMQLEPRIPVDEWVRSIVDGTDSRSPTYRHLLVLGGLLVGFCSRDQEIITRGLRSSLQSGFVKAANLALSDPAANELAHQCIVLSLNYTFPYLTDFERSQLQYDRLLPMIMHAMLHSNEGLQSGYFLGAVDADVRQVSDKSFNWPASSPSFFQVQKTATSPLVSSLGPLSRLAAHTVEHVSNPALVSSLADDLAEFSQTLYMQWRKNKLSEIDVSEEARFLTAEALDQTIPQLWKLLRQALFSVVVILRSVTGRVLGDRILSTDTVAPRIAQQALATLRNLNFIFARLGSAAFSQYTFTYLTAIDILTSYPQAATDFIQSISPTELGRIPSHPLDRAADLFFLNIAEHFTLVLPPEVCETLLIAAAKPYLATGHDRNLLPIFEAAHSVMLAVFASPITADVTTRHIPFYVDALFRCFPASLSARQFRLAFKNLVQITSPPSHIARTQPLLAATLLELAHHRALNASTEILPADPVPAVGDPMERHDRVLEGTPRLSEQAVLVLTIVDSLPHLEIGFLEEWLPLTAELVNRIQDPAMREECRAHMWEVMSDGSMDSERSQVCVGWWTSMGGQEMLLYGANSGGGGRDGAMMSGGLEESEGPKL